ncbi:MAG: Asp-tRNA(Asn)/Glu-tRNA(Gln) amidotransferase subunit GatC [Vicinamibacterales bacterium]
MLASAMPAEREDFPIARVAALARIQLSPAEAALYQAQLAQMLAFVGQVAGAAIDGPAPGRDEVRPPVLERPDAAGPSLDAEAALANAPDAIATPRLVRVPKVIG